MGYIFNEFALSDPQVAQLERYVNHHIAPGGFLMAVLENNLMDAVASADSTNIHLLPAYVGWLYNEAPAACWGSAKKVAKWLAGLRG